MSVGNVSNARYSIGVWDTDRQSYTPQRGLSVPSFNITVAQLRTALKELRKIGYACHRLRDSDGSHYDNDWRVLVERTDGKSVFEIMRGWKR